MSGVMSSTKAGWIAAAAAAILLSGAQFRPGVAQADPGGDVDDQMSLTNGDAASGSTMGEVKS